MKHFLDWWGNHISHQHIASNKLFKMVQCNACPNHSEIHTIYWLAEKKIYILHASVFNIDAITTIRRSNFVNCLNTPTGLLRYAHLSLSLLLRSLVINPIMQSAPPLQTSILSFPVHKSTWKNGFYRHVQLFYFTSLSACATPFIPKFKFCASSTQLISTCSTQLTSASLTQLISVRSTQLISAVLHN